MRAQNWMATIALASMTAFAACGGDDAAQKHKSPIDDQVGGAGATWVLKTTSTCAESEDNCVGKYGFSLSSDGAYTLGPSVDGKIRQGRVSAEELSQVADILEKAKASAKQKTILAALNGDAVCAEAAIEQDLEVVLTQKGKEGPVIKASGNKLCHAPSLKQNAAKLHETLAALTKKYYVLPFPDACLDGAAELELQYADLQSCNSDTDCAYIDNVYGAIPSDQIAFVMTDDCSIIKPLVVANAAKVGGAQERLLSAREDLRGSCGDRIVRQSCDYVAGFETQLGAPTCVANKCVVNSAVYRQ